MRILIVDDSKTCRLIMRQILEEQGHECVEAEHGGEALALLHEDPSFEVAMVDWEMPGVDGLQLVGAVRTDRRFDGLRLIMVTKETGWERVRDALEAGADEYVMKPFTAEMIGEKLELLDIER